jgi:hypothetical protein
MQHPRPRLRFLFAFFLFQRLRQRAGRSTEFAQKCQKSSATLTTSQPSYHLQYAQYLRYICFALMNAEEQVNEKSGKKI